MSDSNKKKFTMWLGLSDMRSDIDMVFSEADDNHDNALLTAILMKYTKGSDDLKIEIDFETMTASLKQT